MKKIDNIKLITVGDLLKELKKYEKKHWDWNVEISTDKPIGEDDDLPCIIIGMGLDEDGDLRIEIEEEWADGGDYYVAEFLEHLRDFDHATRVYLAGGGLLFSIDNRGGIFAATEDDDTLICDASVFGEYQEEPTLRISESDINDRVDTVRKINSSDRKGTIALVSLTAVILFGLCYNVYALIAHSTRHAVWENIGGVVLCVVLLIVCGGTLFYSKDK